MNSSDLILVTGGGGFLGRHIVHALQSEQSPVRIFCRSDHPDLRAAGVDVHQGDIRNAADIQAACIGVRAVIHAAGITGVAPCRTPFFETNLEGTRNLLAACRACGVERLVFTSSPSVVAAWGNVVNGDESLPYPRRFPAAYPHSKALAEQEVLLAADGALAACALRPHLIWGPGDRHLIPRIVEKARQRRLFRIGDGRNVVSLTHVANAAQAHVQALKALTPERSLNGNVYFVADAEPVQLWSWIEDLLRALGLPGPSRSISLRTALLYGTALDAVRRLIPAMAPAGLSRFVALQLGTSHSFSTRRAAEDFGYAPTIHNEDGRKELVECLTTMPPPPQDRCRR